MSKIFFALLLVTMALACQIVPYHPKPQGKAHREFTLEFQFACRRGTDFDSCQGSIYWNDKMILAVAPEDHKIHLKVMQVFVNEGDNSLKFVGTGESDRRGLTIDNVKLVRYGTKVNICVNGDFEKPILKKKWKIFNKIPGWSGEGIEIGRGTIYNKDWTSQVVELDSNKNSEITQNWTFDSNYILITPTENSQKPEVTTGVTEEEDIEESESEIDQNEPEIAVEGSDQPAIDESEPEIAVEGSDEPAIDESEPEIAVEGSDQPAIDESEPEIAVQGGVDEPAIDESEPEIAVEGGVDEPAIDESEPEIEISQPDEPAIDDSEPEILVSQPDEAVLVEDPPVLVVDPLPPTIRTYFLEFEYACRKKRAFDTCQGLVFWNGNQIAEILPSDYKIHKKHVRVDIDEGDNELRFEGSGVKDGLGLTIDNVKLLQEKSRKDIVVNGGFEQPDMKKKWKIMNKIPGWEGKDIEVGWGKIYNNRWNSQVVELDGKKNAHGYFVQKWTFDKSFKLVNEPAPEIQIQPAVQPIPRPQPRPAIQPVPKPQPKPAILPVKPAVERVYTLEFEYACRKNIAFDSCQGNVFWNGKKVANVVPVDHKVHKKVVSVTVNQGSNDLKFQGSGKKDSYGLTIDNVKLFNVETKVDIIVNGGFEQPDMKKKWKIMDKIPGWEGKDIEVGWGKIYNKGWNSQVVELDGKRNVNGYFVQKWTFDKSYQLVEQPEIMIKPAVQPIPKPMPMVKPSVERAYTLEFEYACRKNIAFESCQGDVFWNGKKVANVVPVDHNIHKKVVSVTVNQGSNDLKFQGSGKKDSYGLTIDNVKLFNVETKEDIVVNGGFEQPDMKKKWKIMDKIPGWEGKDIEVGWGKIYNKGWNSQVVELDGKRNVNGYFVQKWTFDKSYQLVEQPEILPAVEIDQPQILPAPIGEPAILVAAPKPQLYRIEFEYACRKNIAFDSCEGNVFWNEKKVFHVTPNNYKVHKKTIEVEAVIGTNSLKFEGEGKEDSYGLTIDNVKVIKVTNNKDVAVNGDFEKPDINKKWKVFDSIPGWKGKGIEIGWGEIYNKKWNSQVVELDGHKLGHLEQKWTCDAKYNMTPFSEETNQFKPDYKVDEGKLKSELPPAPQKLLTVENPSTKSYKLTFQYACRKNVAFNSCEGKVFWNGALAHHIVPVDHDVHDQTVNIDIVSGENVLKFEGAGKMDTYGLTIDNVKFVEVGTDSNIVVNGGFEKPDLGKGWKVFDEIPGWKGKGIEVGFGKIYNQGWNSQVVELDGHDHGYLAQKWNFDDSLTLTN